MFFNLPEVFQEIETPAGGAGQGDIFFVRPVVEERVFLGKSLDDKPAFLIQLGDVTSLETTASLELANLRVRHRCKVRLILENRNDEETILSVVECLSEETHLHSLFLDAVGHTLPNHAEDINARQVIQLIAHLVELFRLITQPTDGRLLGLWTELLVIRQSLNPIQLTKAWHAEITGHADFADELERLEVKGTTDNSRRHELSFEQANPPEKTKGAIISIITEEIGDGCTLGELWDACLEAVSSEPDLCAKIDKQCIRTLGEDWMKAKQRSFDRSKALETARVFSVADIPRISTLPRGVGKLRFESDFKRATALDSDGQGFDRDGLVVAVVRGFFE